MSRARDLASNFAALDALATDATPLGALADDATSLGALADIEAMLTAIATGTVPPQYFTDGIHYTAATKTVLGNMIYARMRDLNVV